MPAPTYVNMTVNQKTQAQAAYNDLRLFLGKADADLIDMQKTLDKGGEVTKDQQRRFENWFGPLSLASVTTVKDNIHTCVRILSGNALTIDANNPGCQAGWFAFVVAAAGVLNIHLCGAFFTAPLHGENSQVGTLVHELTHTLCGTLDLAYGMAACAQLATTNPPQAMTNADNYEYFVESFDIR